MRVLERQPRELGRDYALRVIKDNIERLELEPGSMISENELAAEMGLSRTPVREALIELGKVNIIEIYPQRGSYVALIDYKLVEESRFMRKVLECAIVRLVCEMAEEPDLTRLRENLHLQKFYLANGDRESLMQKDNEFHQMLFEIAEKPQVYKLMENIQIHFVRVRQLSLHVAKDLRIVEDHSELIEAIEARDADRAEAVMERHLSRYKYDAKAIRERYPDYIKD